MNKCFTSSFYERKFHNFNGVHGILPLYARFTISPLLMGEGRSENNITFVGVIFHIFVSHESINNGCKGHHAHTVYLLKTKVTKLYWSPWGCFEVVIYKRNFNVANIHRKLLHGEWIDFIMCYAVIF